MSEDLPSGRAATYRGRGRPWILIGIALTAVLVVVLVLVSAARGEDSIRAADPVIAAAGDIACDPSHPKFANGVGADGACQQKAVSDLLVGRGLSAVLALGDLQYQCGGRQAFQNSYDRSWGRVKDITHPVPGNHEYLPDKGDAAVPGDGDTCDASRRASAYYEYFGTAAGEAGKGYYSFDLGSWHIIALNANCPRVISCDESSRQVGWLRKDLEQHQTACTLAFWHQPRFSSGEHGDDPRYDVFWQVLYNAGVDVVLNGHDHIYERLAPQTPAALPDPAHGIRQFTVGTGGANLRGVGKRLAAHSEVRGTEAFGVLRMTLRPNAYDWEFVPAAGGNFRDAGSAPCHGSPQGGGQP